METTSTPTTDVTLKLLIDTKGHKVLYAESGKEFVDFLFTIMSLPVGTVIRLLSKDSMVGSLGKLYDSIESIGDIYMLPDCNRDTLLKPTAVIGSGDASLLLTNDESVEKRKAYMCVNSHRYVADDPRAICPKCKNYISTEVPYVAPQATTAGSSEGGRGYVKDIVTYMIMDNLEVNPLSTIACLTMLNKFNVKEVGSLEQKVVNLGMEEGLKLLKASLESNSVLTNVFLGKKEAYNISMPCKR
ncbi:hypothetical protein ABKV19_023911 [Rosa sericea]